MGQSQPQSVYNPLNPMAPKFNNQMPPNPMSQGQMGQQQIGQQSMGQGQMNQPGLGGMFKNPMMGQRNPQMGGMGGQYYDPRYQGYQHPQWSLSNRKIWLIFNIVQINNLDIINWIK